jgi:hypothetical protein
MILLAFFATTVYSQQNNSLSELKDFQGIWRYIPPSDYKENMSFFSYRIFHANKMTDLVYWKNNKTANVEGPLIIGFHDIDSDINKLSDLKNKGQRMYFYLSSSQAPNDSIKYTREVIANCFASFNGIGIEDFEPVENSTKKIPNHIYFNFNGRDYESWMQLTHLPNFVIQALLKQNIEGWKKIRPLLPHDYSVIRQKAIIYSQPEIATRMYLIKDDVVEVLSVQEEWLQIKYYEDKNGNDTGKTIEGWIKKRDVE